MITITEAKKILSQNQTYGGVENSSLERTLNRVLAQDLRSPLDAPQFTNSAMDGFAVRWEDVQTAASGRSVTLPVIGESQAGIPFADVLTPGAAVRINTGAPLPSGADTVVAVENTQPAGQSVQILAVAKRQQHVRFQGEEFRQGDILVRAGTLLSPPHIALLASVGFDQVPLFSRPRLAIITTGTELVATKVQTRQQFQIYDSNTVMLQTAIEHGGGVVTSVAHVCDDLDKTIAVIKEAQRTCDMVIISGGVSVGPHDHVKTATQQAGFSQIFWEVRQKPGKPLFFARAQDKLLFGLPGNPVSALMGFSFYVYPMIAQFDHRTPRPNLVQARTPEKIANPSDRASFVRVRLERGQQQELVIKIPEKQGSHMLTSVSDTDGYLLLEEKSTIPAGGQAQVHLFPWKEAEAWAI